MAEEKYVLTQGVEYVEYAVRDLEKSSALFERLGFDCVGFRTSSERKSKLYVQGDIRFVLTASSDPSDLAYQFTRAHGDGVMTLGYRVPDAEQAYQLALKKGAQGSHAFEHLRSEKGSEMGRAEIQVYGDIRNAFVSYDGNQSARLFEEFFPEQAKPMPPLKGKFLQTIDHVTVNVEKGQLNRWADFHQEMFGFHQVRYFDIRTGKTGLLSRAMRNQNGRVTMPFNEPTEEKSQIQEFINTFHGPGVQHIAFHTSSIILCLEEMMKKGFKFLTVPAAYYEEMPKRVKNIAENIADLQRLGILADGGDQGYLLQIFTENLMGPLFFEFIQRKGDNGFGDGNFRALFESIERDQMRRGVL